jgi:hypothetical protein
MQGRLALSRRRQDGRAASARLPLTERLLGRLPGPRVAWVLAWAAVPIAAGLLPSAYLATVGVKPLPLRLLIGLVFTYAVVLAFWAVGPFILALLPALDPSVDPGTQTVLDQPIQSVARSVHRGVADGRLLMFCHAGDDELCGEVCRSQVSVSANRGPAVSSANTVRASCSLRTAPRDASCAMQRPKPRSACPFSRTWP